MKFRGLLSILLPGLSLFATFTCASPVSELKAELALLRNLSIFTDWPKTQPDFSGSNDFKLCTYKDFTAYREIKHILDASDPPVSVKKKVIKVENIDKLSALNRCHAVLLTRLDKTELSNIISHRGPQSPLLFGSSTGWGEAGIHFNFFLKPDNRLGFELNMEAMELTGHSPKYQLLNYAKLLQRERRL